MNEWKGTHLLIICFHTCALESRYICLQIFNRHLEIFNFYVAIEDTEKSSNLQWYSGDMYATQSTSPNNIGSNKNNINPGRLKRRLRTGLLNWNNRSILYVIPFSAKLPEIHKATPTHSTPRTNEQY